MDFKEVKLTEAHTIAMLTLVLPGTLTLVTMAITTMRAVGREDQW